MVTNHFSPPQSAVGFDYKGEVEKHASQKGEYPVPWPPGGSPTCSQLPSSPPLFWPWQTIYFHHILSPLPILPRSFLLTQLHARALETNKTKTKPHIHKTMESNLCWPTTLEHGACHVSNKLKLCIFISFIMY